VWSYSDKFTNDALILQTDYEGQAKKLLELMESTDVIIVAGGDGTLQEVRSSLPM
jgi:acylglycerol kinase